MKKKRKRNPNEDSNKPKKKRIKKNYNNTKMNILSNNINKMQNKESFLSGKLKNLNSFTCKRRVIMKSLVKNLNIEQLNLLINNVMENQVFEKHDFKDVKEVFLPKKINFDLSKYI